MMSQSFQSITLLPITRFLCCVNRNGQVQSTGLFNRIVKECKFSCPIFGSCLIIWSFLLYSITRTIRSTYQPLLNYLRYSMEKRRPGRPVGRSDIRDKLLAAARTFSQHPYSKVTTREIAELAGSNLAMIHYYFGSKEGLYKAVLGMWLSPLSKPGDEQQPQPDRSAQHLLSGDGAQQRADLRHLQRIVHRKEPGA